MSISAQTLRQALLSTPKVELHDHLEGHIRPDALIEVARKHNFKLPTYDLEELSKLTQVLPTCRSLVDFLETFKVLGHIFLNEAVIEDLTYRVVRESAEHNIHHLELRFSPIYMAEHHGLDPAAVCRAVSNGVERAEADGGIQVSLIVVIERQKGLDNAWRTMELAVEHKEYGVVALDLANDEYNFPPRPFAPVFRAAKDKGLAITVHAGEAGGAENVRIAIEELGADRIGHGVNSLEDSDLLDLLSKSRIPLEMCPTSNLGTGTVRSMPEHPIKSYLDRGICVVVCTDDAGILDTTLAEEYLRIHEAFGLDREHFEQLLVNSAEAAFLPDEQRRQLSARILGDFRKSLGLIP